MISLEFGELFVSFSLLRVLIGIAGIVVIIGETISLQEHLSAKRYFPVAFIGVMFIAQTLLVANILKLFNLP